MFQEVQKALGANLFRAFVVVLGCLWIWHTFFSGVAEVGTAQNVTAQGASAALREPAIARGAAADAQIKEATAREALRRQRAEADEAEARAIKAKAEACSARAEAAAKNMRIDPRKMQEVLDKGGEGLTRLMASGGRDETLARDCDPARARMQTTTGNILDAPCFKELQAIMDALPSIPEKAEAILDAKMPVWHKRCPVLPGVELVMYNSILEATLKKMTGDAPLPRR